MTTAGLVVPAISDDLSADEKVKQADQQLKVNRANCEGMDNVASQLETLISSSSVTYVCDDKFDADCSTIAENSKQLVTLLFTLTQLSSADLQDETISTTASTIVSLISDIKILSMEQKATIMACISSIRFTVFVYVSQISIIESKKLEIAGALTFPGATTSIFDVAESDKTTQKTVIKFQLTNLFKIDNANDRVIDCITSLESLPTVASPQPNTDLQSEINKVPAMCGAPSPPVEDVQTTAANIVQTCNSATQQPTQAELRTLVFIKQSLITFKQTFTSQITIFSNKLTALTDETATAASLEVDIISSTGQIAKAEPVDVSGDTTEGTLDFYVLRFEVVYGSLSAIGRVLAKLKKVLAFTDYEAADSSVGINFALLVSQLTSSLSSGVITTEIITISRSILKMEVTSLPSLAVINVLQSALFSAQSLQITLLAKMTILHREITKMATSLSSVTFDLQELSSTGAISTFSVPALSVSSSSSQSEVSEALTAFQKSRSILLSVQTFVIATLNFDFSSVSTAVTVVDFSVILSKLSAFFVELGTNVVSTNVETLSQSLLELKIGVALSQTIESKVEFMLYLIRICDMMLSDIICIISPDTCTTPSTLSSTPTTTTFSSSSSSSSVSLAPSTSPTTTTSSSTPTTATTTTAQTTPPTTTQTTPPTTTQTTPPTTTQTTPRTTTRYPTTPTTTVFPTTICTRPPCATRAPTTRSPNRRYGMFSNFIWKRVRGIKY